MGKFSAYKLPLKSLPAGTHRFDYKLGKQFFDDMENPDVRNADLDVAVDVTLKGDLYELDIKVTGEVTLQCDRCLDELQWPIDTGYHIYVKYGEDYNDDSDELLEIPFSDNDLNISYMLHDTVALAIPIKHTHPLGKCNRAMSNLLRKHRASGRAVDSEDNDMMDDMMDEIDAAPDPQDAPADPRWDGLKKLSDENDD